jgi:hypothetical protein
MNKKATNKSSKTLAIHKSSDHSYQEARNSLKGKKL